MQKKQKSDSNTDGWTICDELGAFPKRIVQGYLESNSNSSPQEEHIIRHFHTSITDEEIRAVKRFSEGWYYVWLTKLYGDNKHFELLVDAYFRIGEKTIKKKLFIGIERDEYFGNYRITGIRHVDGRTTKLKQVIYAVDKKIYNWHPGRALFKRVNENIYEDNGDIYDAFA